MPRLLWSGTCGRYGDFWINQIERQEVPLTPEQVLSHASDEMQRDRSIIERKRIEEQLALYREVIAHSSEAIAIIDPQGRYLEQNAAHRILVGYPDEELVGETPAIHLGTETFAEIARELNRTGLYHGEVVSRTKDGFIRDLDLSAFTVRNEAGEVLCHVGIKRDITERRRSEEALRESEERYRRLVESTPEAIAVHRGGRILYVNPAGASLLGARNPDALTGQSIFEFVHPDYLEVVRARARRVEQEEQPAEILEEKFVRLDGQIRDVEVTSIPITYEGRRAAQVVIRDVTERKRAEEALRFLTEASSALAASLDYEVTLQNVARLAVPRIADWCIVDVVGRDSRIRRLAVAGADPRKEELLQELLERYPPDWSSPQPAAQALRAGRPVFFPEFSEASLAATVRDEEHLRIMRGLNPLSAVAVPMVARGQTLGTITFATSESGRQYGADDVALAQELGSRAAMAVDNARLYSEIQQSLQTRDAFLAAVAHDLKTPLTSIKALAQLLERVASRMNAPHAGRLLDGLERIDATATKMTAQINELLDLTRLQMGRSLELERCHVDVVALAQRIAAEYQQATERQRLRFETAIPHLVGNWDPARLERVLANLLSNAIKYSLEGGEITVSVAEEIVGDEHWAVVSVGDQGIGIPAADLPHIFERFFRAANVSGRMTGTGIGLAAARQIVEQHGGTITVSSQEGAGATFTVRLPIVTGEQAAYQEEQRDVTP